MADALRFTSSMREVPLSTTLEHARRIAASVGISRVTDTTRLDCIGLPVFASIRPEAVPGSLHVSAGKGLHVDEARVGAYMEAIELAYAEPGRACVEIVQATVADLLDERDRPGAAYELCPLRGAVLESAQQLACVRATDLRTGAPSLVPAELVLFPAPKNLVPKPVFGSDGNGLASGNTLDEAVVHALGEVIERDVMAFVNVRDDTRRIRGDTLPPQLRTWFERLDTLGFDAVLRWKDNVFELPWCMVVIRDRNDPSAVHMGFGCNVSREIAAGRALAEAAQQRLTIIHGGRDDLPASMLALASLTSAQRDEYFARLFARFTRADSEAAFEDMPDYAAEITTVPAARAFLLTRLVAAGIPTALYVRYTPPELPLQVVKVIVPKLELHYGINGRIGRRLGEFMRAPQ